jgi:hypothetical protein
MIRHKEHQIADFKKIASWGLASMTGWIHLCTPRFPWRVRRHELGAHVELWRHWKPMKFVTKVNVITGECRLVHFKNHRIAAEWRAPFIDKSSGKPKTYKRWFTRAMLKDSARDTDIPKKTFDTLFPHKDANKRGKNCPFARSARARINAARARRFSHG